MVQARGYQLQDRRSGQEASVRVDGPKVQVSWKESQTATPRTGELELPRARWSMPGSTPRSACTGRR